MPNYAANSPWNIPFLSTKTCWLCPTKHQLHYSDTPARHVVRTFVPLELGGNSPIQPLHSTQFYFPLWNRVDDSALPQSPGRLGTGPGPFDFSRPLFNLWVSYPSCNRWVVFSLQPGVNDRHQPHLPAMRRNRGPLRGGGRWMHSLQAPQACF